MTEVKTYNFNHQVNYYECDPSGHMSLSALIALLILTSEKQNSALGFDEDTVQKFGGGWVIIDYEAHFHQPLPRHKDNIKIQTHIKAYNKFFVVRHFLVLDQEDHEIVDIDGLFVYMDLTKRKMTKIPEQIMAPFGMKEVIRLPKVHRPDQVTLTNEWTGNDYRVRYFDIDQNGHVNNAKYFDWMLDPLGFNFLNNHRIAAFRMSYEHEIRPGAIINSQVYTDIKNSDQNTITQHKILVNNQESASATIAWRPIEK